jgi:hypothetical protein
MTELAEAQQRARDVAQLFGSGQVDRDAWAVMNEAAKTRAKAAQARLDSLRPADDLRLPGADRLRAFRPPPVG